jgi:hypothetical protein
MFTASTTLGATLEITRSTRAGEMELPAAAAGATRTGNEKSEFTPQTPILLRRTGGT